MLTADEAARLTEAETLELIFRPGFSTAEEITEISGRGVGMDVVQSVLQRLKGTVQIDTPRDKAQPSVSSCRLRWPSFKALLFRVEQRLYALPLNAVARNHPHHGIRNPPGGTLRGPAVAQRGLPLLATGRGAATWLADSRRTARKIFVLVINHGERKFGLIVNELAGEDELVIKALDDQTVTTDLVSGASILGDGRVVLILNLSRSWTVSHVSRANDEASEWRVCSQACMPRSFAIAAERRMPRGSGMKTLVRVLVVDDSALMRKLIPQILRAATIPSKSSARPWTATSV